MSANAPSKSSLVNLFAARIEGPTTKPPITQKKSAPKNGTLFYFLVWQGLLSLSSTADNAANAEAYMVVGSLLDHVMNTQSQMVE